jgi:integrase
VIDHVDVADAVAAVREQWRAKAAAGQLQPGTATTYERNLGAFERYVAARGITDTTGIDGVLLRAWVHAPVSAVSPGSRGRAGQLASAATRRNRLMVLRQALAVWVERGWIAPGLLDGEVVSKDQSRPPCPLTPAEVDRIHLSGRRSPIDTLIPALVALALAGLGHAEIARLTVAEFDADEATIWVGGRSGTRPRTVPLNPSATRALTDQAVALQRAHAKVGVAFDPIAVPLALHPRPRSVRDTVRPTVVGQHLHKALHLAGIRRQGVTAGSLPEYAANRCYALTNRVEDVAALLGLVSLDAAMRLIDPAWQTTHADTIRSREQVG